MVDHTRKTVKLPLILIPILTLVIFLSLLFNIETLKLGNGLGREVNFLTNDVSETYDLNEYKKTLRSQKIELNVFEVDQDRLLMKFVGVDDVEAFSLKLRHNLPNLEVYETGTFNSIATVNTTTKTLQSYFVVLILIFVVFWTYRYRIWGLMFSIFTSTISIAPLYILNEMGYIFNFNLWFTFILIFSSLVLLSHWTINNIYNKYDIEKVVKNHSFYTLLFTMTAIFLSLLDAIYANQAIYFALIALALLLQLSLLKKGLPIIRALQVSDSRFTAAFAKRGSIKVPDIIDSRWIIGFMSVLIIFVAILSAMDSSQTQKHYRDFSKEHYMIVDNSDASSFLEVQASLGKFSLDKNLLEYKISEEKKTWYVFDEFSAWSDLYRAKEAIQDKLDVDVLLIQRKNFSFTYANELQVVMFVIFTTMVFILHYILESKQSAIQFISFAIPVYIFVLIFLRVFHVHYSLKFNVLQAVVPLFVSALLMVLEEKANNNLPLRISTLLGFVMTILAFLILPIVLLIPDLTLDHYYMISLILIFSLSIITSLFVYFYKETYLGGKK